MELFFNFFFNVEVFRFWGMGVGGNDGRNEVMCGGKRRLFVFLSGFNRELGREG